MGASCVFVHHAPLWSGPGIFNASNICLSLTFTSRSCCCVAITRVFVLLRKATAVKAFVPPTHQVGRKHAKRQRELQVVAHEKIVGGLSLGWSRLCRGNCTYPPSPCSFLPSHFLQEFFSENLWEKVPRSWQATLSNLTSPQLSTLLLEQGPCVGCESVWPLSLLAYRASAHALSFSRQPWGGPSPTLGAGGRPEEYRTNRSQSSRLSHHLRRHVKPKKQHEIRRLGAMVKKLCDATGCQHVVDVGSGQSDDNSRETLGIDPASIPLPHHRVGWVDPRAPWKDFLQLLESEGVPEREGDCWRPGCPFVLTGLHACGDLGPAALRQFARCPSVLGITTVSCCYMKATTLDEPAPPPQEGDSESGYPMSAWVQGLPGHGLPYMLRELACHAIEDYAGRLKQETAELRVHCYRAALETIIRQLNPLLRRPGVQTGRKAHLLPFKE
ncbi:methyltransferase-like protein 25B isoform X2 [Scyliorhinus torazame]|uniref:methyltransferase-like protein 25B isoform X2 n=1 Tax=Scyliorhinus torazame TaxID=75743 RepID=UPI003B5AE325